MDYTDLLVKDKKMIGMMAQEAPKKSVPAAESSVVG
jgi:hypothetical protein